MRFNDIDTVNGYKYFSVGIIGERVYMILL